ncbi:MAG: Hsp20/alpha crystallin family protein [Fidelibacterota bacterium]
MSLIKWSPTRLLSVGQGTRFLTPFDEMDRFFDRFLRQAQDGVFSRAWGSTLLPEVDWVPAFDVVEKDKSYEVHVEAPRMKKGDFKVTVHDGVLTVSGEKKVDSSTDDKAYTYRESAYGRFCRSFRLPDDVVDEKKIKADYKDGVLMITIPRSKPADEKAIEVEIS